MPSNDPAAILFDPNRLAQARRLRGLLKTELANKVGVTPAAISQFEAGDAKPAPATLRNLAITLSLPVDFFGRGRGQFTVIETEANFRSLRSTSKRERSQAAAQVELLAELVELVEHYIQLPDVDIPLKTDMAPDSAAEAVREAWGLGLGPISDVVGILERHGVVVARLQSASERVDAFSCRIRERPYVLLASNKDTADRSRFDAAHELGHLVLHFEASPGLGDAEVEAHRFASSFLMPRLPISAELPRPLNWDRLLDLKLRWRVSLQALLRRGRDLEIYRDATYRRAFQTIGKRRWRTHEPGDVGPAEQPRLLRKATGMLTERYGSGLEILAERTLLPDGEIHRLISMFSDQPEPVDLPPTDDDLRRGLVAKLHPERLSGMRGMLQDIVGYILDEPSIGDALSRVSITPDEFVEGVLKTSGEEPQLLGDETELKRGLLALLNLTPDLTPEEAELFGRLRRERVKRW